MRLRRTGLGGSSSPPGPLALSCDGSEDRVGRMGSAPASAVTGVLCTICATADAMPTGPAACCRAC